MIERMKTYMREAVVKTNIQAESIDQWKHQSLSLRERREAKAYSKQYQSLKLYFEGNLKPRQIATKVKVSRQFVYQAIARFKSSVNNIELKAD